MKTGFYDLSDTTNHPSAVLSQIQHIPRTSVPVAVMVFALHQWSLRRAKMMTCYDRLTGRHKIPHLAVYHSPFCPQHAIDEVYIRLDGCPTRVLVHPVVMNFALTEQCNSKV